MIAVNKRESLSGLVFIQEKVIPPQVWLQTGMRGGEKRLWNASIWNGILSVNRNSVELMKPAEGPALKYHQLPVSREKCFSRFLELPSFKIGSSIL